MSFLPSLPKKTNLSDVVKRFPSGWEAMFDFHDEVLRGKSPLTIGERELIAAYVSALNACSFCWNAHRVYAESYGIAPTLLDALKANPDAPDAGPRLTPLLAYVKKLTLAPKSLEESDISAMLAAGWSEEAVADANKVTALYNFMNRIVIGMGVDSFEDYYRRRLEAVRARPIAEREAANRSDLGSRNYRSYGRQLGIVKD
ncbi:MAG: carboxymuconolactone decarboxylase family protein [Rhodothalassiaceae bacterium]